jgi:hypothetical protein
VFYKSLYASAFGTLGAVVAFFLVNLTILPSAFAFPAQYSTIGQYSLSGHWVSGTLNAAQLPFHDRFQSGPVIELIEPEDGVLTNQAAVTFSGSVDRPVELEIDQTPVPLNSDLGFTAQITLPEGTNLVELRAQDAAGAVSGLLITVNVDLTPPPVADVSLISIAAPVNGEVGIEGASGSAVEGSLAQIINLRTGETIWVEIDEDGSFSGVIEGWAGDTYEIIVHDLAGNESEPALLGGGELDPPMPQPGIANPIIDLEDYLYRGPRPVQIVDDPEVFDPRRFAVVRGFIADRNGDPLPGVTVRVHGHPELGFTHSREDGEFDMAVNGGSGLVFDFERHGLLPAQRRIHVPWQDYVYVDEVSLIELDEKVTVIDLTDESAGMQVARGSVETDADGPRQATVLFPAGTTAQAISADGEPLELEQISFRATEYTVGERGPNMMPGDLPANVGYTYAVELSVDEALAAAATSVEFDQAVPFYVENFLEFPTGTGVPVGYYDRQLGIWVGYDNGAVIEILDIVDGKAVIDVTGDGPASAEDLESLHITDAELMRLAETYSIGDSLQRVALSHFSPWDLNFPIGLPDGAEEPPPFMGDFQVPRDEEDQCVGCTIYPQSRSIAKDIPIAGTPFTLRYDSQRSPGYLRTRKLEIPITSDSVHPELIRVEARVTIAGQEISKIFDPEPDTVWTYQWDGLDVRGRELTGPTKATIEVDHIYPMWYRVPEGWQDHRLWGMPPEGVEVNEQNRFTLGEIAASQTAHVFIEPDAPSVGVQSASLGGWTISAHHALVNLFDSTYRMEGGDGSSTDMDVASRVVTTFAGSGEWGMPEEGMLATEAPFKSPTGIAASAKGEVYFALAETYKIWKVGLDGTMKVVAGTGEWGYSGDGGLAVDAQIGMVYGIALDENGSLYIADSDNYRVRKVNASGVIETVAGTGVDGFDGDGGLATEAEISWVYNLAVGSDGVMLIADDGNNRLRQVGSDGYIQTILGGDESGFGGDGGPASEAVIEGLGGVAVNPNGEILVVLYPSNRIQKIGLDGIFDGAAGSGESGFSGDGGPATEASILFPFGSPAISETGVLYFQDVGTRRIRSVTTDGIINTVAGNGDIGFGGDHGPGEEATLALGWGGVALGPDGSLYIADTWNIRIRKLAPSSAFHTDAGRAIASEDGRKVLVFNDNGQHIASFDAIGGGLFVWL